jgi:hypothetical protein
VYIVRDPRDIAVSFYYYNVKTFVIPEGYPMDEFVERFLVARVVPYADRVGTWQDHVLSWTRLRLGNPNFALIRYEDLLSDPARELTKVAPMVHIEATPDRVERAVARSSAGQLRSLELKESKRWETTKDTRQDIPFIREAKSGGWRRELSATAVQRIESTWGTTMEELGYELSHPAADNQRMVSSRSN